MMKTEHSINRIDIQALREEYQKQGVCSVSSVIPLDLVSRVVPSLGGADALEATGGKVGGNVGWHQDWQYWRYWEDDSELFTAWIAISDVQEDSGPVSFLVGSHRWGFLDTGDFLASDLAHQLQAIQVSGGKKWREVPTILSLGSISFHHRLTYHSSGPNVSSLPRRSVAIHLRTEKSSSLPGAVDYYVSNLEDPQICPIIYQRSAPTDVTSG